MWRRHIGIILGLVPTIFQAKTVYLIPFSYEFTQSDKLFSGNYGELWKNLRAECMRHGFKLTTKLSDFPRDAHAIVMFNQHAYKQIQPYLQQNGVKKILYLWEPPTVMPQNYETSHHARYDLVMTWNDDLVDGVRYHKFFNPQPLHMRELVPFAQRKLCAMVAYNKSSAHPLELYSARRAMIDFFVLHAPKEFDLYGFDWPKQLTVYRGAIDDKEAVLSGYKFCIAFENMRDVRGYITEKMFHCFNAGCVPVYWGASNVTDYVPKECFIDYRDFGSPEALYEYLVSMSEEAYEARLAFIKAWQQSQQAKLFSDEYFIEKFIANL